MTYYEAVKIGSRVSPYYYCKICEEGHCKTLTTVESEIKMIRHIQMNHPEKDLVLEVSGRKKNLVPAERPTGKKDQPKQIQQVGKD